jgi:two-component system, OmpR family, response regulator VanR
VDNDLQILKKMTILFVEDDPLVLKQITSLLSIFFDKVLTTNNGQEAYKLYEDEKPDIILSDIEMPKINGFELFYMIRTLNPHIPIIALSAYSDRNMLLQAANAQIDAYIVKPVELGTLLDAFRKIIPKISIKTHLFHFENNLIYNANTEELFKETKIVDLGKKEKILLKLFIHNKNRVIEKDELMFQIWPHEDVTESALKNLLNRLRNKIGFELIVSVKGSGWRLNSVL